MHLPVGIALAIGVIIMGLASFVIGVKVVRNRREASRQTRIVDAFDGLRDTTNAIEEQYKDKRTPLALTRLLRDSWLFYIAMGPFAVWPTSDQVVAKVERACADRIAQLNALAAKATTLEDLAAEESEVTEELRKLEAAHAQEVAELQSQLERDIEGLKAECASELATQEKSLGERRAYFTKQLEQIAQERAALTTKP
jgi:DNA repair exonuclease SbcCD ATPase subunit